jgi:dsRNA-specific ribonuclease
MEYPIPRWVGDTKILVGKVREILSTFITDPEHLAYFLSENSVEKYWKRTFTHKSVNPNYNYETLEFYGDKVMNYAFAMYLYQRFGSEINQTNGTLLMNIYVYKQYQAKIANNLGLKDYIYINPNIPTPNVNIREDVVEAFFGSINQIGDEIQMGLGYVYCYNFITVIYNEVDINPSSIPIGPKTVLNQIYAKMGFGEPRYMVEKTDDPRLGEFKVSIVNRNGDVISTAYGSKPAAEVEAARLAIEKLKSEGITEETANEEKINRLKANSQLDAQIKRVEQAIEVHNKEFPNNPIARFDIRPVHTQGSGNQAHLTFGLEMFYKDRYGKQQKKTVGIKSGNNAMSTKIDLLKDYADSVLGTHE